MAVYIQNIATSVPKENFEQSFLRDKMKEHMGSRPAAARFIHSLYANSGIEKRHTVVNDFHSNGHPRLFFQNEGELEQPSTGTRNELYTKFAKELYLETAGKLLADNDILKKEITQVITVSCTGFYAPEPAFQIVTELGLPTSTERYHIGFMGCFGVFPALKMARSFCEANPDAVVMVVAVELCSLHLQDSEETDHLISATVFADGAAGAIVSSKKSENKTPPYKLDAFQTSIVGESEEDMAWTIGDTGFDMVLSTYIPDIIQSNLDTALRPIMDSYKITYDDITNWAVHPGGRAILDKVEQNIPLQPAQLRSSRTVLANYGNMSSATILFVLKELLRTPAQSEAERTLAMSFGPGITVESALLTRLAEV